MRKKTKILLGALLLLAAVATRIPLSYVEAASTSASDFQMKGNTLVRYTGTASAVSIPTSVKHIGNEVFAGHTEIVKIDIPGYVETIAYNAFEGCTSLRTISIPDTVTEIGNGAFGDCTSLASITLGKKVSKLGTGIFTNCTSLSSARISRDNEELSYDAGVIYSKDKKILHVMLPGYTNETYKMPSDVEEIKSNAFWGCKNLKKVEMGSNVKVIPDYAFANCTNLEKVILPYSLRTIGIKAFADCINLGETEIPMSVSDIHGTAFDGCPKLTIVAETGSYAAEYEENREKSNVSQAEYQDILSILPGGGTEGAEGEAGEAGGDDSDGLSGDSSSGGSVLGQSSVVGGNAVVFIDNSQSKVLSGNDRPDTGDGIAKPEVIADGSSGFPKYTIVNNEKIASQAFYNNTDMTSYKMPDGIKEIGDFSFARSGLNSVVIPEGVTAIGYGAFYHCDNLTDITIPSTVTTIEPAAFAETAWMKKLKQDRRNPYTVVGDGILVAYSGMESRVEIPEGVKQIGAEVFKDNSRITSVKLPESLTVIGEDAFADCHSLTSVSGGNNLREIRDRAFENCPISTIKIPASVQEIGLKAYDISGAGKADETKVAVFLGRTLPKLSYEKTATRLVNENYRDGVFKDVQVAVVDGGITASDISGTVLDYDTGDFRGLICSVEQMASDDTPGRLLLKYCVEKSGAVSIGSVPEQMIVYGRTYEVIVPEGELTYILGSADNAAADNTDNGGAVRVENNSATLPSSVSPSAEILGGKDNYILRISDNRTDGSAMAAAYRKAVPGSKMTSLQVYDITLYDAKRMIPISRLGNQQMTVTLPKPNGIAAENMKVVCLDEDGQLEAVDSRTVTVNGQACIQFDANHFSVYGIFN